MEEKTHLPQGRQPHKLIRSRRIVTYEQMCVYLEVAYMTLKKRIDIFESTGHTLDLHNAFSLVSFIRWYERMFGDERTQSIEDLLEESGYKQNGDVWTKGKQVIQVKVLN